MSAGVGEEGEAEGEQEPQRRETTCTPFVWSDGSDFVPDIHNFDRNIAGVTNDWPLDNDAQEVDYRN